MSPLVLRAPSPRPGPSTWPAASLWSAALPHQTRRRRPGPNSMLTAPTHRPCGAEVTDSSDSSSAELRRPGSFPLVSPSVSSMSLDELPRPGSFPPISPSFSLLSPALCLTHSPVVPTLLPFPASFPGFSGFPCSCRGTCTPPHTHTWPPGPRPLPLLPPFPFSCISCAGVSREFVLRSLFFSLCFSFLCKFLCFDISSCHFSVARLQSLYLWLQPLS